MAQPVDTGLAGGRGGMRDCRLFLHFIYYNPSLQNRGDINSPHSVVDHENYIKECGKIWDVNWHLRDTGNSLLLSHCLSSQPLVWRYYKPHLRNEKSQSLGYLPLIK